jgi:hypothetical protein
VGDCTSLHELYDVSQDINERSPLVRNREADVLDFAHDLRKGCCQTDRAASLSSIRA